jgi:hypothetical protein
MNAEAAQPLLIRRKSGRTAGAVVAFGIGGGLLVMGIASAVAGSFHAGAVWPAIKGYVLALLPLFVFGAVLAVCRRELWLLPEERVLRMLTFRPWLLRGPRVEEASLDEYVGVRTILIDADPALGEDSVAMCVVALVPKEGDQVPLFEMSDLGAAHILAERVAELSGLPIQAAAGRADDAAGA